MLETGDWNGITTKGKASIFVQVEGKFTRTCWNCGYPGRTLTECKKAKNPAQIEKSKLLFREKRRRHEAHRRTRNVETVTIQARLKLASGHCLNEVRAPRK
jgi:hypothetical protein